MKRATRLTGLLRWGMPCLYLLLLFAPFFFPVRETGTPFWQDGRRLAVFVFWGVGWPLIILATMLFGRVWCGIFCPDGTLSETVSRIGKKGSIPRWIRWKGWPPLTLTLFITATALSNAAENHTASLALLGLLTVFAILTGLLYGNGRRIWCMYLCPSNALFALLAKGSPFHFSVDRKRWDSYSGPPERIHCAPLVNIRKMTGASDCHACGRCSGYRNAVTLAMRSPAAEILSDEAGTPTAMQALALLFGLCGIGLAVTLWGIPEIRAVFGVTGLMPLSGLFFVPAIGAALALVTTGLLWLCCRIGKRPDWKKLALCLVPLAGTGFFLGLTKTTLAFLQPGPCAMPWIQALQLCLLAAAFLFSIFLGLKRLMPRTGIGSAAAFFVFSLCPALLAGLWAACLLM